MMTFKPRPDLLLVKRVVNDGEMTAGVANLILPKKSDLMNNFVRLEIIAVGDNITDLKPGDIVIAEDIVQKLMLNDEKLGVINQKYVHLIQGKDA